MALLFSDGFDNYTSSANLTAAGYSPITPGGSVTASSTGSRWNTGTVTLSGSGFGGTPSMYTYPFVVAENSLRVAFWVKTTAAGNEAFLQFTNASSSPNRFVTFRAANNSSISITGLNSSGSSSALLTGSTVISDNQWHHVEASLIASQSSATIQLWIDGTSQGSFTGVTSNVADTMTVLTYVVFVGNGNTVVYDDLVVWDDSGTDFTGYMGPHRTRVLRPNGAGSTTNFTASTGSNWENVDETVFSSTDYNEASTATNKDLYAYPDLSPLPATIKGVALRSVVHNPDVGTKTFRLLCKSGSTTANGATFTATSAPKVYMTPFGKDPNTSAAWDSAINSAEFGIEVVS